MLMIKTYTISVSNDSNDVKVVGYAETLIGAKRIGRRAVKTMLPNGEGRYTLYNRFVPGRWWGEVRSSSTKLSWVAFS
jgi:hypothetical protein